MKYVQKKFLKKIYVRSKLSCVRSSHDLCARAHVHSLEGTMDDTLNPVLRASVCWTFRPHDPPVFKTRPTTPQFSNQIGAAGPLIPPGDRGI